MQYCVLDDINFHSLLFQLVASRNLNDNHVQIHFNNVSSIYMKEESLTLIKSSLQ